MLLGLFAILGLLAGYGVNQSLQVASKKKLSGQASSIIGSAQKNAKKINQEAEQSAQQIMAKAREFEAEQRKNIERIESRVIDREEQLDLKLQEIDKKQDHLSAEAESIKALKTEIKEIRNNQISKLEKIAELNKDQAKEKLFKMTEKDIKEDLLKYVEKLKLDAKNNADSEALNILTEAMARIAGTEVAEKTVTSIVLPDEIKGKIIGKEGRNIQAIEKATGVDVLLDDTPGYLVLSSFDPIRRQVARVAIENLMKDGRIHPGKIEEEVAKAEKEINKITLQAGEEACREAGVVGLPKEVVEILGSLKFRTSFGQNVLHHSIEMSKLAVVIAKEVGADVRVCRIAALVHDLGKAVTHEMEGKHHHLSRVLLEKYGIEEAICHAAEAHHDDIEATTPEAMIVRAVDALSAGRPGARSDNADNYSARMSDLENVANAFSGVEKSYAISAGREIRIFVKPEQIDDLSALRLAKDIATRIETTLRYPGTIKVNVIRETRATEYAK